MDEANHYLVAHRQQRLVFGGKDYEGVPCKHNKKHFLYALPLTAEIIESATRTDNPVSWAHSLPPVGGVEELFVRPSWQPRHLMLTMKGMDDQRPLSPLVLQAFRDGTSLDKYVPLPSEVRQFIVEGIRYHAERGRDAATGRLHRHMLDTYLWFWTADAYNTQADAVARDRFKFDFAHQHHTQRAHEAWLETGSSTGLIHEHAVPKKLIVRRCIEDPEWVNESTLAAFCLAVIVHVEEDRRLRGELHSNMPEAAWRFRLDVDSPFARNEAAGVKYHQPGGCPVCEEHAS